MKVRNKQLNRIIYKHTRGVCWISVGSASVVEINVPSLNEECEKAVNQRNGLGLVRAVNGLVKNNYSGLETLAADTVIATSPTPNIVSQYTHTFGYKLLTVKHA